jgi:hypothetical protein
MPTGIPGMRITLAVEVRSPPDVHVYAPGTRGYKPIKLLLDPIPQLQLQPVVYPPSKTLYLPAIKEQVPVLEGSVHIRQDIQVATERSFGARLAKTRKLSRSPESSSIKLATRPLATCRPRSPSNGSCSCFHWTARVTRGHSAQIRRCAGCGPGLCICSTSQLGKKFSVCYSKRSLRNEESLFSCARAKLPRFARNDEPGAFFCSRFSLVCGSCF